jgi:hypothetical protein
MSVVIEPSPKDGRLAGNVVAITALGLVAGSNAQGKYLALGYDRQATASIRDNVVVIGNPMLAINESPK